jgi:integrase/recombinase XerD
MDCPANSWNDCRKNSGQNQRTCVSMARPLRSTTGAIPALLAAPDQSTWSGRRDHALLMTLYNRGALVSEVTTLKRAQVCFGVSAFVQLTGKGRKERTVPLWPNTAQVVQAWFSELGDAAGPLAFPNARGKALVAPRPHAGVHSV